jgi:hypothetical protein
MASAIRLHILTPELKITGSKFWAIVGSDRPGLSPPFYHPFQSPNDSFSGKRRVDLDRQNLPRTIVDNVERSEFAITHHCIAHKIHTAGTVVKNKF